MQSRHQIPLCRYKDAISIAKRAHTPPQIYKHVKAISIENMPVHEYNLDREYADTGTQSRWPIYRYANTISIENMPIQGRNLDRRLYSTDPNRAAPTRAQSRYEITPSATPNETCHTRTQSRYRIIQQLTPSYRGKRRSGT